MVNVNGVQPPTAPKAIEPAGAVQPQNQVKETINVSDTVEISTVAKLAARVQQLPEVRTELVQRVKAEIEAGLEVQEMVFHTVGWSSTASIQYRDKGDLCPYRP